MPLTISLPFWHCIRGGEEGRLYLFMYAIKFHHFVLLSIDLKVLKMTSNFTELIKINCSHNYAK